MIFISFERELRRYEFTKLTCTLSDAEFPRFYCTANSLRTHLGIDHSTYLNCSWKLPQWIESFKKKKGVGGNEVIYL